MGQLITVTSRAGVRPEVMHFELNRSLTGMQTERYPAAEAVTGDRPPDALARRLFELGASGVTIYSSTVTVTAAKDKWPELQPKVEEAVSNLFIYYREGDARTPAQAGASEAAAVPAADAAPAS